MLGRDAGRKRRARRRLRERRISARGFCSTIKLEAPQVFLTSTQEWRGELVKFIRRLRHEVVNRRSRVFIDFTRTKKMYADGTLLFAANLDLLKREAPESGLLRAVLPADSVVRQVLQHIGILRMLDTPCRGQITADNVRFWKVESGNQVLGQYAKNAHAEWKEQFSDAAATQIYEGLTEAMTNCVKHAYGDTQAQAGRDRSEFSRWWMFSQRYDGQAVVVLCDLGMGIPVSLKKKWSVEAIARALMGVLNLGGGEAAWIRAAMEVGRSRTELAHRGKGLMQLREAIEELGGSFCIDSNKGQYRYEAAKKLEEREILENFGHSIGGTLIRWSVPLRKEGLA